MKIYKLVAAIAAVLLAAVALQAITGYGLDGVKNLGTEQTRYGVKVTYYKKLFKGQELMVSLRGLGKGYTTCITLWGWAPSGKIIPLGKKCGTGSSIKLPAKPIVRYLEDWREALLRNHNNPESVEPGVIVMTAINKPGEAVYSLIKTAPINIPMTLAKKASIKITVRGDEVRHALIKPVATWSQLKRAHRDKTPRKEEPGRNAAASTEWPPRSVPGALTGGPYYWYYEATIAENDNAYLPVEILHLNGYLQHFKNDAVELMSLFKASHSEKIGFTATYAVSSGFDNVEAQYGVAGPTLTLSSKSTHVYYAIALTALYDQDRAIPRSFGSGVSNPSTIDTYKRAYIYPMGPQGDTLLAIGYKGQAALAEYCLAFDLDSNGFSVPTCTDTWANLTLHRPFIVDNKIIYWYEVDNNPEDGEGVTEKVYKVLAGSWARRGFKEVVSESVWIHFDDIVAEFDTVPVLGISIPVVPLLLSVTGAEALPPMLTPVLGATVGYTSNKIETSFVSASLHADRDTNVAFDIYWIYDPQRMYYKGSYYYLGTAIFDIYVSSLNGGPHPCPPGGSCPTGSNGSGRG